MLYRGFFLGMVVDDIARCFSSILCFLTNQKIWLLIIITLTSSFFFFIMTSEKKWRKWVYWWSSIGLHEQNWSTQNYRCLIVKWIFFYRVVIPLDIIILLLSVSKVKTSTSTTTWMFFEATILGNFWNPRWLTFLPQYYRLYIETAGKHHPNMHRCNECMVYGVWYAT